MDTANKVEVEEAYSELCDMGFSRQQMLALGVMLVKGATDLDPVVEVMEGVGTTSEN